METLNKPIITSLLDTDLYKFTMAQCVLHRFTNTHVQYKFKCRTPKIDLVPLISQIKEEIKAYCSLRFTKDELDYLRTLRFIKPDFVDFLRHFQPCEEFVKVEETREYAPGLAWRELEITIEGPWIETIWFEVPILAIVNELYFRKTLGNEIPARAYGLLDEKIGWVKEFNELNPEPAFRFAEFGTRRRFSKRWQDVLLGALQHPDSTPKNFHGTSNVYFAKKYGVTPIGTMAHEFLQAPQQIVRIRDSQKYALEQWTQEYRGDLGIALTDVVGIDAFLKDFDLFFCKLFDGVRHDSGDPVHWLCKVLDHYEAMKIDPTTKIAVFSDGLDFKKCFQIYGIFKGKIKMLFAIGTNLTNDVGVDPLNIVIKMTECNGRPVAKVSDSTGKEMCRSSEYIEYLKEVFGITRK